jgi:nitroreductase
MLTNTANTFEWNRGYSIMELDDAIRGRRSVRSYAAEVVPKELIREILEAATWAPSAKNGQQWRFTVLTGASKKKLTDLFRSELQSLSSKIGEKPMGSSLSTCRIMEQASVLVMVWNASGGRTEGVVRAVESSEDDLRARSKMFGHKAELQSVAAAIQNMCLKAYSLGLGSLWIADIYYAADTLTRHLGKPWELVAAVTLGWPAATPNSPPRMTVEEVTEFSN